MNKALKITVCVVAVVWIFACGLVVGTFSMRQKYKSQFSTSEATTQTQPPQTQTQTQSGETSPDSIVIDMVTNVAPQTLSTTEAQSSFELPKDNGNATTYEAQTQKQLAVPSGSAEISKALVDAINQTKSLKGFNAEKSEKADFAIDNVTGGNTVKNIVEGIINKVGNKPLTNYSFSNGADTNGSDETPMSVIAPKSGVAVLNASAVKSASAKTNSDGGYDIIIVLNDETQTLSQKASAHDGIFDTLNINDLAMPSAFKMSQLNFTYSDAEIKASVNSDGRLTSVSYNLPISKGEVEGTMLGAGISVSLHGAYSASVKITY